MIYKDTPKRGELSTYKPNTIVIAKGEKVTFSRISGGGRCSTF